MNGIHPDGSGIMEQQSQQESQQESQQDSVVFDTMLCPRSSSYGAGQVRLKEQPESCDQVVASGHFSGCDANHNDMNGMYSDGSGIMDSQESQQDSQQDSQQESQQDSQQDSQHGSQHLRGQRAEDDPNDQDCAMCGANDGRTVICCDGCPKSFHVDCYIPPIKIPRGKWFCGLCTKAEDVRLCNTGEATPGGLPRREEKVCDAFIDSFHRSYPLQDAATQMSLRNRCLSSAILLAVAMYCLEIGYSK